MRHRPRRSPTAKRLGTLLALALLAGLAASVVPLARAASGTVVLEIAQAESINKNADAFPLAFWAVQQDFYPKLAVAANTPLQGPEIAQRDWAVWQPAFSTSKTYADLNDLNDNNIVSGTLELWDADDIDAHDQFDINASATPGRALRLLLDVCSLRYTRQGDLSGAQFSGPTWMPAGNESDPARVQVNIGTSDGRSLLPNNLAIADAGPVQAVYHPRYIIDNKPTAFKLDLTSTHTTPVNATVTVQMSDGITTVSDSKPVVVPPEGLRVFLFDGSGTAAPFRPRKQPNLPRLQYSVAVDAPADSNEADKTGPFPNCVPRSDNALSGSAPMITTNSPRTLYLPWDFGASAVPGESITPAPPSLAQVASTALANERLRAAILPIAAPVAAVYPGRALSLKTELEPGPTILGWSVAAHIAGIDTLELMPRQNWFADRSAEGLLRFGAGAIGMSLAEFAPHAVIAEQGYSEVAIHEQGHTFQLSRRPCSTGGAAELLFGLGCRDEYNHAAADGAPYLASGYDVVGAAYPSGLGGAPGTREVLNAINIMDSTGALDGGPYDRWIDNLSYDWLSEQLRRPQDPPLVAVSGFVRVPGGLDAPSGTITGQLGNAFRFDGIPDMPTAALGSAQGSGEGQFFVRLVTAQSERRYRFTPLFDLEGDKNEYGFFALAVPWDPATTKIELVGPTKGSDLGNPSGATGILIGLNVSSLGPTVSKLRAAAGKAPDLGAAQHTPPTIQPGERIVIAWDQQDADTGAGALSAILYLTPPKAPGNLAAVASSIPFAINLVGGQATLQASQLAGLPGDYGAKIVVSDGVNTTSFSVGKLFTVREGVYLPITRR